jgi:hypothetical protein
VTHRIFFELPPVLKPTATESDAVHLGEEIGTPPALHRSNQAAQVKKPKYWKA